MAPINPAPNWASLGLAASASMMLALKSLYRKIKYYFIIFAMAQHSKCRHVDLLNALSKTTHSTE
jgi:hypothetical protein